MITLRPAAQRGHADHGWLDTYHTFSFGEYQDAEHMGFRSLRVLNEDRVAPGQGFGAHPHANMEILTYVLEGALEHKDSLGNGGVLRPGEVQTMSAGTGIRHSEFNHSKTEPVHFLQVWLYPDQPGHEPRWAQRNFSVGERTSQLRQIAAGDGLRAGEALPLHQDAAVYAAILAAGEAHRYELAAARAAWVQVARGKVEVNGRSLNAGDGVAIEDEAAVELRALDDAELLLFDLA